MEESEESPSRFQQSEGHQSVEASAALSSSQVFDTPGTSSQASPDETSDSSNPVFIPADLKEYLKCDENIFKTLLKACRLSAPKEFKDILMEEKLQSLGGGKYARCYFHYDWVFKIMEQKEIYNETILYLMAEMVITNKLSILRKGERNRAPAFPKSFGNWVVWDYEVRSNKKDPKRSKKLFVIHDLEYGGVNLSRRLGRLTVEQAISISKQIALALAVAEQEFEFEHRDLKIENIAVKTPNSKELIFILNGQEYKLDPCGIKVTIIDFSLSRATLNKRVFCPGIKAEDDYRHKIINGKWESFYPKTNCQGICKILAQISDGMKKPLRESIQNWMVEKDYRLMEVERSIDLYNILKTFPIKSGTSQK